MKCGNAFALISLLLFSAYLSAQVSSSTPTDTLPGALPPSLSQPGAILPSQTSPSETPDQVSSELLAYADRLDQLQKTLKELFQAEGISLSGLDGSLFSSQASVDRSISLTQSSLTSIVKSQALERRQKLNNTLWRSGTLVFGLALVGTALGFMAGQHATLGGGIGGGSGAAIAGVWLVFDYLPKPIKALDNP